MASSRRTPLLIGIGVVAVCSLCLQPIACRPNPKAIIAQIPLGSRLSELDQHLVKFYEDSEVVAWVPNPKAPRGTGSYRDKFGGFDTRNLGSYEGWNATQAERDRFTGEVRFFHFSAVTPDDLAPSFFIYLVYIDGELKEAHYGYLPG